MSKSSAEVQKKWSILARGWRESGPPATPSPEDVSNYIQNIPKGGNKVLVLGCTPALRNRLISDGFKAISIDITFRMIELTNPLVLPSPDDIVLQGNWLSLPLKEESVDAIIGDKVIGNVMPEDWPSLFFEIKRVLRPGGAFLTRATPHGEYNLNPPPRQEFRDLIKKWVHLHREGMKLEDACSGLWEDCMDMSTVHLNAYSGTQQLVRVIPSTKSACVNEAGADLDSIKLVQLFISNFWPSKEACWSAYTIHSIIEEAGAFLDFKGTHTSFDYPEGDRQPIFHFHRR